MTNPDTKNGEMSGAAVNLYLELGEVISRNLNVTNHQYLASILDNVMIAIVETEVPTRETSVLPID